MNTNSLWTTLALTIAVFAVVVWFRGDVASMGRGDTALMDRSERPLIGRDERTLIGRGGRALLEMVAGRDSIESHSPGANSMLARFNSWLAATERAPSSTAQQTYTPVSAEPVGMPFKTDSVGQIVPDEAARLEIERLVTLNSPAELQDKLQKIAQSLPPAAANRLPDLIERYNNYATALRQTYPSDQAASSEQEALTQLDGLHALRTQYFGAEVAEGFFAEEEKTQRQLIELMKLEKAQALYQTSSDGRGRD